MLVGVKMPEAQIYIKNRKEEQNRKNQGVSSLNWGDLHPLGGGCTNITGLRPHLSQQGKTSTQACHVYVKRPISMTMV